MGWIKSQIETRMEHDSEMNERAYAELAAGLTSSYNAPRLSLDDMEQADGAARLCLQSCGVQPGEVPDDVTDLNERLNYLCRPSGTMRRVVRLDKDWHKRAFGAMLGKLDTGESIALLSRGVQGYRYYDPSTGKKVKVTDEVARHIDQEAVLFYRPLPPRPLTVKDLMRFIFSVFTRSDYAMIIGAAAIATLVGLLPAWANSVAFGVVVPLARASLILPIGALLLGMVLSTAIINACRNLVMQRVSLKLEVSTEAAVYARILALPTSFFKQYEAGDLGMRISQVSKLSQLISSLLLGSGLTLVLSIVYVFQIAVFAPALVVPALVIIGVQVGLTILAAIITARYERATMNASAELSGTVTALLNGIQKIKLAGAEERAFAQWAHGYADYERSAFNRPAFAKAIPAIVAAIGILGTAIIYYSAGAAHISVADYMAFNVAFGQIIAAMTILASLVEQFAQIKPMIAMISPILEAEPEIAEGKPLVDDLTGDIEVSNVTFRYNDHSPYVVRNLSFKVRPGEYIALVGKSGCGKSTILRLLLGFEEPESGGVFYGPYNLSTVDKRSLRKHIGVVMQDGQLFLGDIASNITVSNPAATADDAWEAAELAGIAEDIRKMPMGMKTIVSEGGGGISGGQRQRLMIARAICGKRNILMFDEATSALDNLTQKHVSESLDSLKCTRIAIAHRLSTIRHCDRILVVDGGTIAEEGTYEELLEKDGLFAELVKRQRLDMGAASRR